MIEDRTRTGVNGGAAAPSSGGSVVWVFDERRRVRDDVASRLVALPFVGRVEAVGDPASLLARLATRQPDVLLVGTQRATDNGLAVATQVLRSHPGLSVLVLGAPDDAETVRAAVAFGARGYLRWDASPVEMGLGVSRAGLRAEPLRPPHAGPLSTVGASSAPASWSGSSALAGAGPTTVRAAVRVDVPAVSLSVREMQVLTGMSQGKSNAQIGRELYLSEDTIKTHARRLFRKLGAKDRAEAVATGFRRGMMS
ncbi:response regulator transcription factor [Modestobacter sp. Leaf380]|uniref:LuxR family transcriptional regulator n=1 Tax=Modestobacter sp. Leaf380 TaxID=1736356 RepID=UPI0006FA1A2B|nr:response regulator transcription factor [Modestobacter sp. Leaf380]KQS73495.1 LuxR family transcriptional regulator [Modestobacter sp. Leaf380]